MNINTATLLNMLSPKINPAIKDKIDSVSTDGKINLTALTKDKSIQTVLTSLLKDISVGTQTKETVSELLQNNKQNFSFKNLSEDVKNLIKIIQSDSTITTKLETQLSSLKASLIDINKIDEKVLKNNISNSGVFLESKLAQQTIPITKNLEQLVSLLKNQLSITNNSEKPSTSSDMKLEIKNAIENILKSIKTIQSEPNMQIKALQSANLEINIKSLQQKIENFASKQTSSITQVNTSIPKDIEQLSNSLKKILAEFTTSNFKTNISSELQSSKVQEQLGLTLKTMMDMVENTQKLDTNLIQTKFEQINSNQNIPKDIKLEIKNAIENLLRDISHIKNEPSAIKQSTMMTNIENNMKSLQQKLDISHIKSDLVTNIKNMFVNAKEQLFPKNSIEIKNVLNILNDKINMLSDETIGAKNLKSEISTLLTQMKSFEAIKNPLQQQTVFQNILHNSQALQAKVETMFPNALFENNISKSANFIQDLKLSAAIIQEQIQNSQEPITKDLKASLDKINTQIEFFQLLSYTTNGAHTYLSFLQDEIEDSDIKFNKNNDESFSCAINLTLKKYGKLKVLMILDNKNNVNINIGIEDNSFKIKIQENLQKLRVGINGINLLIQSLNVFSLNDNNHQSIKNSYGNYNSDLSFGLDIKA